MSGPAKVRLLLLTVPLAVLLILRNYVLPGVVVVDRLLGAYFALCLFAAMVWVFSLLMGLRSHPEATADMAETTRKTFTGRIFLP
jgi:hypothetical protein